MKTFQTEQSSVFKKKDILNYRNIILKFSSIFWKTYEQSRITTCLQKNQISQILSFKFLISDQWFKNFASRSPLLNDDSLRYLKYHSKPDRAVQYWGELGGPPPHHGVVPPPSQKVLVPQPQTLFSPKKIFSVYFSYNIPVIVQYSYK